MSERVRWWDTGMFGDGAGDGVGGMAFVFLFLSFFCFWWVMRTCKGKAMMVRE